MEHQHNQAHLAHNTNNSSTKTILLIIISVVVLALVVILLITQTGEEQKTAILLDKYNSITAGVVMYGDTLVLDSNGNLALGITGGDYFAEYKLEECANPSAGFDYEKTSPSGEVMKYDPLKEKVILNEQGKFEKITLSEEEQRQALITESVYSLEVSSSGDVDRKTILEDGTFLFSVGSSNEAKISFRAKCDGAKATIKVYTAD